MQCIFAGTISIQNYEVFLQKICPLKEHNMHFHMPNLLLKGAISLFYTNIPAQDAILLTQDILLKSATCLKICDSLGMFLLLLTTKNCPLFIIITNQFSFEEVAFLETWFTYVDIIYILFPFISPGFIYSGLQRQLSLETMF